MFYFLVLLITGSVSSIKWRYVLLESNFSTSILFDGSIAEQMNKRLLGVVLLV